MDRALFRFLVGSTTMIGIMCFWQAVIEGINPACIKQSPSVFVDRCPVCRTSIRKKRSLAQLSSLRFDPSGEF